MTCTTHHHACACREARFQEMFKAQEAHVKRLEEALLKAYGAMTEPHGEWKDARENAALPIIRDALASKPKVAP